MLPSSNIFMSWWINWYHDILLFKRWYDLILTVPVNYFNDAYLRYWVRMSSNMAHVYMLKNYIGPIVMNIVFIPTPMYVVCILVIGQGAGLYLQCNDVPTSFEMFIAYMYNECMNISQLPINYGHNMKLIISDINCVWLFHITQYSQDKNE